MGPNLMKSSKLSTQKWNPICISNITKWKSKVIVNRIFTSFVFTTSAARILTNRNISSKNYR
jgi:hypothetical protein